MQQVFRNQTQDPIYAYPSDLDNFWSRAFVRVETPSKAMPDETSWSAAQIDRAARSVTVEGKEGATSLTHSTIGITPLTAGNQYIIEPANGEPNFIIKIARLASSSVSDLQDPLPQNVPIGSNIRGYRVSVELQADEVTNVGQSIARWRVEDRDRLQYIWDQPFLIVNAHTNYTLNSSTLERMYPMVQRLRQDDISLQELIEIGWTNYVRPDLEGKGLKANQIKSWERLEAAHGAACVYHLVLTDERQEPEYRETLFTNYTHHMDLLFAGVRFWYDEGDGKTPTRSPYDYSGRSIMR